MPSLYPGVVAYRGGGVKQRLDVDKSQHFSLHYDFVCCPMLTIHHAYINISTPASPTANHYPSPSPLSPFYHTIGWRSNSTILLLITLPADANHVAVHNFCHATSPTTAHLRPIDQWTGYPSQCHYTLLGVLFIFPIFTTHYWQLTIVPDQISMQNTGHSTL